MALFRKGQGVLWHFLYTCKPRPVQFLRADRSRDMSLVRWKEAAGNIKELWVYTADLE